MKCMQSVKTVQDEAPYDVICLLIAGFSCLMAKAFATRHSNSSQQCLIISKDFNLFSTFLHALYCLMCLCTCDELFNVKSVCSSTRAVRCCDVYPTYVTCVVATFMCLCSMTMIMLMCLCSKTFTLVSSF